MDWRLLHLERSEMTGPIPRLPTLTELWFLYLLFLPGYALFAVGVFVDSRLATAFRFGVAGIAILIIIRGALLWLGERQKETK